MNNRLPVHDCRDLLERQIIKPHGLDDLEPLIHKRRAVDGDFRAHFPVRVAQRVGLFLFGELRAGKAIEGPSGTGQNQALNLRFAAVSHQTLENCRVLGVDGDDLRAVFFCLLHHELARTNQSFLVGKRDAFFLPDGSERWLEADHAGDCCDDRIRLWEARRRDEPLEPQHDCYIHIRKTRL